ncbi:hypothetical protein GCM10027436_68960 [Actinophytocola sediminis]
MHERDNLAGVTVVDVDDIAMPDAEYATGDGLLPGAHAKLAGPPSRNGSTPSHDIVMRRRTAARSWHDDRFGTGRRPGVALAGQRDPQELAATRY